MIMSNILDAVGTFHIFSKMYGLTVFSVNPKNFLVEITIFDFIFYFSTITFHVCCYINFWRSFTVFDTHSSEIVNLTIPILISVGMAIQFINVISQFFLRFRIYEIFQRLMAVDLKVKCI